MRRAPLAALVPAVALLAVCGCSQGGPIYHWGSYEQVLYDMYARPGKADPTTQVAKLTADIERAQAEGRRVPPGVYAHLGYMYYTQGNVDAAHQAFVAEKTLFPESAVFIDGILARMKRR